MHTIKEAALRTGLKPSTIRAWERRYGVVQPVRSRSGYRLYDEAAVGRLLAMRRLVDDGWLPSEAARAIKANEMPAIAALAQGTAASAQTQARTTDARRAEPGPDRAAIIDRFVRAAAAHDTNAVEAILDEIGTRGRFEAIVDDLLLPAAAALGDAWESGQLDAAAEHAASAAVLRRLANAYQAAASYRSGPPVLVGLPPGSRHELGALAFAVAVRRLGLAVVYLGPDVPTSSWIEAVSATGAWLAVLGVVMQGDRGPAIATAEALLTRFPDLRIGLGGASAPEPPRRRSRTWVRFPERIVEAALVVRSLWDERSSGQRADHPSVDGDDDAGDVARGG